MTVNENEPIVMTRDEIVDALDREARRLRGISARHLLRSYKRGQLEPGGIVHLLALADLLPEDDPLVADSPRRSSARR